MQFPYFGDADAFLTFGENCSRAISTGTSLFTGCYNGVRPIGALLYFSLPNLITKDPVTASYTLLAMNLGMLLLLAYSAKALITQSGAPLLGDKMGRLFAFLLALVVIALSLPFVPVALADLPACAMFFFGMSRVFKKDVSISDAIVGALFLGLAALTRQNYYVFAAFAGVGFAYWSGSRNGPTSIRW